MLAINQTLNYLKLEVLEQFCIRTRVWNWDTLQGSLSGFYRFEKGFDLLDNEFF